MRIGLSFAVLAALGASSAVAAQVRANVVLGGQDAPFAQALEEAGYSDLSAQILGMMKEAGTASGPQVEATLLATRMVEVRSEDDAGKRKQLLAALVADTEQFVERYPTSAEAASLRNSLPEVYQTLGETIAAELEAAKDDVGKAAAIRKQGEDLFAAAEGKLAARVAELKDALAANEGEQADEAKVVDHMVASYGYARLLYFHSLIEPAGDYQRQKLLEAALEKLQEFDLDYEERLMNIEARVFQALCLRDLGRDTEALDAFNSALSVREAFGRDGDGPWKVPQDAADYLSVAARQKVAFLAHQGKNDDAIEAAQDYLKTTPDALNAAQGKAVLYGLAQAQSAADPKAAAATAAHLMEVDPRGYWGYQARLLTGELLGGKVGKGDDGDLSPQRLLAVAETLASGAEPHRAVAVCMHAIDGAAGQSDVADVTCDAYMIIGAVYAKESRYAEAAVAFDAAHDSAPAAKRAGEALWRAINCYIELRGEDKRDFYKKRIQERMTRLATDYPNDPNAASAQLVEGREAEAAQDFKHAAELYLEVREGSPAYFEAQLRAGNSLVRAARAGGNKDQAAVAAVQTQAGQIYQHLAESAKKAAADTLDAKLQQRLRSVQFEAQMGLAAVYMAPEVGKGEDALALLDSLTADEGLDAERSARVWEYRIRALDKLGRVGEAGNLFESLLAKGWRDSLAGPAGQIASRLDAQAAEMVKKQGGRPSAPAVDLWRRAARYYGLSLQPQLAGRVPLRTSEAGGIAQRLFAIGLIVNEVPEVVDSFAGVDKLQVRDATIWQQAAAVDEAILAAIPSAQAAAGLGRVHGFLGHYADAEAVFGKLFAEQQVVDPSSNDLDKQRLSANPVLLPAYLEWGVASAKLGEAGNDAEHLRQAQEILARVGNAAERGSVWWWRARYWLVRALIAAGSYDQAGVAVRSLERTFANFDDGKYGMTELFRSLRGELAAKGVK